MLSETAKEVRNWLRTKPKCLDDRIVPKREALQEYNAWAYEDGGIQCSPIMLGLAMKALFPAIRTKQIQRGNDVFKAFVMPRTKPRRLGDNEELL